MRWLVLVALGVLVAGCSSSGPRRCAEVSVSGMLTNSAWIDAWTPICTGGKDKKRRKHPR